VRRVSFWPIQDGYEANEKDSIVQLSFFDGSFSSFDESVSNCCSFYSKPCWNLEPKGYSVSIYKLRFSLSVLSH